MHRITKAFSILLIISITRLLQSCFPCDCSNEIFPFDFKEVNIENLDNSGEYASTTTDDFMKKSAVAFEVSVVGEDLYREDGYLQEFAHHNIPNSLGFNQAYAMSCDCSTNFEPKQKIEDIEIYTLFQINDTIPENSDVTDLFVASSDQYSSGNELYKTMQQLIKNINPGILYDSQSIRFKIFLKEEIKNSHAQFEVIVKLSDNRELSQTSYLITIED